MSKQRIRELTVHLIMAAVLCLLFAWWVTPQKVLADDEVTFTAVDGKNSTDGKGNKKYEGREYDKAVDGDPTTKWYADFENGSKPYIIVRASKKIAVTSYTLTAGDNKITYPKSWTLYGSNDYNDYGRYKWMYATWTPLETVTDGGLSTAGGESKTYSLANTTPYWYYKLVIDGVEGGDPDPRSEHLQLNEITFTGNVSQTMSKHKVRYDPNGGEGEPFEEKVEENPTVNHSFAQTGFTRPGYNLEYWRDQPSGSMGANIYWLDSGYRIRDKDIIWYAGWSSIRYYVRFDPNGGTGTMEDQKMWYDSLRELSPNQFTRPGYKFVGWKMDGRDELFSDGEEVKRLTTTEDAVVTLKAEWASTTHKIKYLAENKPAEAPDIPEADGEEGEEYKLSASPAVKGYIFSGWKTDDVTVTDDTFTMPEHDVTFTGVWTPHEYTVQFNANGATGTAPQAVEVLYDIDFTVPSENTLAKTGYTFGGWNTKPDGTGTDYTAGSLEKNLISENGGTVTLYAVWTRNAYAVTYAYHDAPQGVAVPAAGEAAYGEKVKVSDAPETEGYIFDGWASDSVTIAEDGTFIMPDHNVTFMGSWTEKPFDEPIDPEPETPDTPSEPTDPEPENPATPSEPSVAPETPTSSDTNSSGTKSESQAGTKNEAKPAEAGKPSKDETKPTETTRPSTNESKTSSGAGVTMYRLYNPNSGEHLYTLSYGECRYLVKLGWKNEGAGMKVPANGVPVYRLYNPNTGDHHYTTSNGERKYLIKLGWNDEKIAFYAAKSGKPVYRLYNPNARKAGTHVYTTSLGEKKALLKAGWRDEKIGWYAL